MELRRNVLPLGGFLVCLLAFLSYFLFFFRFPVTRDVPWTGWVLLAAGLGLAFAGVRRAFREPERYRGRWHGKVSGSVLTVLSLLVAGFFVFATTAITRDLPDAANAPKVGQKVPGFTLADVDGKPVRLSELMGTGGTQSASWVLLIFYRGYW